MHPTPQELVARNGLSSLPLIYQRLDAAINDPYSDLSTVATIIAEDSSVSARLLRLANSAMFSFPSRVDTISRAVTIIGTKQLRDLVLATSVMSLFKNVPQEYVDMESFWRHAISTGIAARVIAGYRREANVERFYVLGLLHDIGLLLMYMQLPKESTEAIELSQKRHISLYTAERELLGFDHTDVGRELISAWKLPASLREGVAHHHLPLRASHYPEDAATIHIADIISNAFSLGGNGEPAIPDFEPKAWDRLGLSVDLLPHIIEQLQFQYRDAADIFLNDCQ